MIIQNIFSLAFLNGLNEMNKTILNVKNLECDFLIEKNFFKQNIYLKAINNLKISKLLYGYRGKTKGDVKSLVQTILKLSKFAEKNASSLVEVEINPLIIKTNGKGVIAADALIHYLKDIK